jgi:Tfp pilus assembly protein PilX
MRSSSSGSALLLVLVFIGFFSLILIVLATMAQFDKKRAHSAAASYQAMSAAESGLSAAMAQLALATSTHPTFLVGVTNATSAQDVPPVLIIGATNLTNTQQLMPLLSGDLSVLENYPALARIFHIKTKK